MTEIINLFVDIANKCTILLYNLKIGGISILVYALGFLAVGMVISVLVNLRK